MVGMKTTAGTEPPTAAAVWRLLLQCTMSRFGRPSGVLQQMGLTPGHMKALLLLEPGKALPMGLLANQFSCDASTMTWVVDRLEERGLVERRGLPSDRRVKTVALTPWGSRRKRTWRNVFTSLPKSCWPSTRACSRP